MLLSIIIPVYNEKSTVEEVILKVSAIDLPCEKEIIVVDDGSNDGTAEVLQLQRTKITRLYSNPVNVGKGAAVRIGLSFAKGDIILLQDADLETNPDEYLQLLKPIFDGETQVVYGSRFLKPTNRVAPVRRAANIFLTSLTNLLFRSRLTDMETAYKIFTAEVAKKLRLQANKFEIEPEITAQICRLGYKILEVPISYSPRTVSEGKKIKWKDGVKAVWTLVKMRFRK
jgi:glycosyltransferase involved in cell wall biosynthesis